MHRNSRPLLLPSLTSATKHRTCRFTHEFSSRSQNNMGNRISNEGVGGAIGRHRDKPFTWFMTSAIVTLVVCLAFSTALTYFIENMSKSPFCTRSECNGKNPQGTNCTTDAVKVGAPLEIFDNESHLAGTLQLMQSPKCHSNWVRWSSSSTHEDGQYNTPQIWQNGSTGARTGIADQFKNNHLSASTWSNMISDKGDTCFSVTLRDQDGKYYEGQHSGENCTQGMAG